MAFSLEFSLQDDARTTITNLLGRLDFGSSEVCVRINSIDTGLAEEDIRVILTGNQLPHCLVVPKVETVEHIDWVSLIYIKPASRTVCHCQLRIIR